MILDNSKALALYNSYQLNKCKAQAEELHILVDPLITAVASSVAQSHLDDLVQEGHLKLQKIIVKRTYKSEYKTSFYSFLSTVLRNCMIDYMRRFGDVSDKSEDTITYECFTIDADNLDCFDRYYVNRFNSLHSTVALSASHYALNALLENCKRINTYRTLTCLYPVNYEQAKLICNSVAAFCIYGADHAQSFCDKALALATNGKEFTLTPESILLDMDLIDLKELLKCK